MIEDSRLEVTRFIQQRSYYCGPACAQMFLALSDFSISSPQPVAFEEIQKMNVESDKWYSDPKGLSLYISKLLPNNFDKDIEDFPTPVTMGDSFQKALDKISYTIDFIKIPCIALVSGGKHWIIIDGIRFDKDPSGKRDVIGVFIRDPWKTSPDFSYVSTNEFKTTRFLPNTVGSKWKDQYVILTKPTDKDLLVTNAREIMPLGGGGATTPEDTAIEGLELQGFENIEQIKVEGGGASLLTSVHVEGIDGASSYTIVPLDATKTKEFQDFIYVAIEDTTNTLLEISSLPSVLQIYNDGEMQAHLEGLFQEKKIEIVPGYFWKPSFELRSRLAVARRFKLDDREMILLPDGTTATSLTDTDKAG